MMSSNKANTYTTHSCELSDELDRDEMVQCDLCPDWYHFSCVNITSIGEEDDWVCPKCQDELRNKSMTLPPKTSTPQLLNVLPSSHKPAVFNTSQALKVPMRTTTSTFDQLDNRSSSSKSTAYIRNQQNATRSFAQSTVGNRSIRDNQGHLQLVQNFAYTRMVPNVSNLFSTIGHQQISRQRFTPPPLQLPELMQPRQLPFSNQTSSGSFPQIKFRLSKASGMNNLASRDDRMYSSSTRQQPNATFDMSQGNAERIRIIHLNEASMYSNRPSSDHSSSTWKSSISSRRQLIELARIEEERELQEQRDNEYLRRKYSVLLDDCRESIKSESTNRSKYTEDWIKDQKFQPTNQTDTFQRKLDGIKFETTSPLKPKGLSGDSQPEQHQKTRENPEIRLPPKTSASQLFNSTQYPKLSETQQKKFIPNQTGLRNDDNEPRRQQTRTAESEDQGILTKVQIAARQVVSKDLPIFYGKPEDWPMFISRFNNSTKTCGYSNQENLDRLQKCLKGSALDAVRSRLLSEESVPDVIETLRMLFGRPDLVINSLLRTIREEPAPKADKLNTLVDFALKVGNMSSVMVQSGLESHLSNPTVLRELEEKLPPNTRIEWARFKQSKVIVNLETFGKWLHQLAETISIVTEPTVTKPPDKKNGKFGNPHETSEDRSKKESSKRLESQVYVHQDQSANIEKEKVRQGSPCKICQGNCQKVEDCTVFRSYDVDRRWKEIYNNNLCRKCLQRHGKVCNQDKKCGMDGCVYKHHALLHDKKRHSVQTTPKSAPPVKFSNNTHGIFNRRVLLRIVPVTIHAGKRTISTFAYLDDGSDLTMVNKNLIERLGIKGTTEPLCLLWTGDMHRNESESKRVTFYISGTDQSRLYCLKDVRTVADLGLPRQTLNKSELVKRFKYLSDAPIVDYEAALPEILIGSDNVSLIVQIEIIEGEFNQPIASNTRLGWSIHGDSSNRLSSPIEANVNPHGSICPYNATQYDELHQQVKDFFTLENFGVQRNYTFNSKDDERALELLKVLTKRIGNQFETGLLWRYESINLPDSYKMAYKRLQCLEKHKPEYIKVINETIGDYERKGYVSKLGDNMAGSTTRIWYLPIFAVSYPKKPQKIRTVFDAAATAHGVSLNSMLLKGPDQLASLTDILRRFREKKFAITGDIKEMFLQVKIRDEDKQAQRFLWRNGDQSREPDHYVMNVMTFGSKCSPSAAQFVKNLNAAEFEEKYPRAVEAIVKNHYVDDWLDGEDTEEKLENLVNQVIEIHAHGGFEIRNFLSNSIDIKRRFGGQQVEDKQIKLEIGHATERVLGMWWDTESDEFTFSLKYFKIDVDIINLVRAPTKREVLKILMSVFDPLGFLSHYLIHLKILLQDVWRSNLDWDEELDTNSMKLAWKNWFEILQGVEEIRIPRLLSVKMSPNTSKSIEIHVFVDASEQAFSAVAYLRVEDENGVDCSLIASKARVAPLKYLSIPRMELQAGVLGTRLLMSICNGQTFKIDRRQIWSDSSTVLSWIRSDQRKYHQFVANRIGEISEYTDQHEWRWVPSEENIADEATKWKKSPSFHQSSRWFSGPSFLKLSPDKWPKQKSLVEPDTLEEMKLVMAHRRLVIPVIVKPEIFSSWVRMHRSMAYVVRYVHNLRAKIHREKSIKGPLTQSELLASEKIIIRQAQFQAFTDEFIVLKRNKELQLPPERTTGIDRSSQIYKCSPYLDDDDLIRIRGRIDMAANVLYDTKRPIIMPKHHKITRLLVEEYHRIYHHRNDRTVHNEISQKYFIPHLRVIIRSVRNECQRCKIRRAKPIPPEMADLPMARLAIGFRAFTYIGIDYFGPMYVAFGRQRLKRWGMLITCLTVRAINIEIVYKMNTESCIMGLRNHINDHGPAEEIFSDNGTNLKGADNELRQLISEIDQNKMATEFTTTTTKWNFNPPVSPHMGGAWERMVRSVKACLYEILPERNPTDDVLRNLIVEVVNIVNSRPLSCIPLEHEGDEVLTPNHFVKGSSNGIKPMIEIESTGPILRSKWKENQRLVDVFWTKFVKEYLPELTRRSKWFEPVQPFKVGDIVLIIDVANKRNSYPKAKVIEAPMGSNNQVRRVRIQKSDGSALWRSAHGLAKLDVQREGLPAPEEDIQTRGSVKNVNTDRDNTALAATTVKDSISENHFLKMERRQQQVKY